MSDKVLEISDVTFEKEVVKSELPALVDFWAVWCGPCRMIAPIVEKIAETHGDRIKVTKLNVDESPQTAAKYGIMSIPTLLFFKGGEVKETIVGVMPENKIMERIDAHL